jgi:hypothetical protein
MKTILLMLAIVTGATAEPVTITLKSGRIVAGDLVSKSATEIKLDTISNGLIRIRVINATPESWAIAQRATAQAIKQVIPPEPPPVVQKIEMRNPPPQQIRISAASLEAAYDKNPLAADAKYKGQILIVSGFIKSIDKDILDSPYVQIGKCVVKYFPRGSDKKVMNLTVGDAVTLSGVCGGKSLGIIDLKGD